MVLQESDYTLADMDHCLDIFDSNADLYFDASERERFVQFLENPHGPYSTYHLDEELVGCGGYQVQDGVGAVRWGMLQRSHHRQGLGGQMLAYRIRAIQALGAKKVRMDTSQHTVGFYQKFGFTVTNIISNGLAEGMDKVEMEYWFSKAEHIA